MSKLKIILLISFVMLAVVAIFSAYQIFAIKTDAPTGATFTISENESGTDVFKNLEQQDLIRNAFFAKVVSKITGRNRFLKGDYDFSKQVSTYNAIKTVTSRPISLAVLIPEGFTEKQVAERLQKYIKNFDQKAFLQNAHEGYLFPDTYFFYTFATNEEILKEFDSKFNKTMLLNFGRLPTKDEIIIASMIEREAKDPTDMKIISGIIQNRLKAGMPLQIDATVQYGNGVWKDRVLYRDLKKDTDYNTYLNTGLPIGPISNPGIDAIRAAIFPDSNDYVYYLTGKDGKMYYAKTHDDHIKNKLKYLR